MWKTHSICIVYLFRMFQTNCKIILYHTQDHHIIFRTLTFHMIPFFTNYYVRICYLFSSLRQMLIPSLYNFGVR